MSSRGINNLNDLPGRVLHRFRLWRREEGDLEPVTEKTQMDTLRVFIRWLESIDGVRKNLHTKVPTLTLRDKKSEILCFIQIVQK